MEPPPPHLPLKCCFVPIPVCRARQDTSPTDLWGPQSPPSPPAAFPGWQHPAVEPSDGGGALSGGGAGRKGKRGRGSVQKTPISSHPPVLFPGCDIHPSARCTAAPTPTLPRLVTAALRSALGGQRSGLPLEFTSVLPRSALASVPVGLTAQDSPVRFPLGLQKVHGQTAPLPLPVLGRPSAGGRWWRRSLGSGAWGRRTLPLPQHDSWALA